MQGSMLLCVNAASAAGRCSIVTTTAARMRRCQCQRVETLGCVRWKGQALDHRSTGDQAHSITQHVGALCSKALDFTHKKLCTAALQLSTCVGTCT